MYGMDEIYTWATQTINTINTTDGSPITTQHLLREHWLSDTAFRKHFGSLITIAYLHSRHQHR